MKKNKLIIAAILLMLLLISGCGNSENNEEVKEPEQKETVTEPEEVVEPEEVTEPEEIVDDLAIHKQMLLDTNSICGVLYCGFVPDSIDKLADDMESVNQILDDAGYEGIYDFVRNIPSERIIEVPGGYELYCIYPFDEFASVAVNKLTFQDEEEGDGYSVVVDEVLYRSDKGDPILLRCNVSDIFGDTEINIVDSEGVELKWRPVLSGMDGRIVVPDTEPFVYDGTPEIE